MSSGSFWFALVHWGAQNGHRGFAWVHLDAFRGPPVYSGSCGFTWVLLGVVGFIRVRVGSLGRA